VKATKLLARGEGHINSPVTAFRARLYPTSLGTARPVSTATAGGGVQRRLAHTGVQEAEFDPILASPVSDREFWRNVPQYKDVEEKDFLKYRWTVSSFEDRGGPSFTLLICLQR
jgi:hypothetical protein